VAPTTGDVTFHWTFNGQTCAQAGITIVHISADNQVITDVNNNPDIACNSNGVDGTTIGPFPSGTHSFDLVALDSGRTPRFALNGLSVTVVAGQNTVAAPDLAPAAPTTAQADLTWTFDGKNCATAGVTQVQIFVDPDANGNNGTSAGTIACTTNGTDGAEVDVAEGLHTFAIYGINAGHLLYRTHHPDAPKYCAVGLITDFQVSAESPP
jgi:hypothetical protein